MSDKPYPEEFVNLLHQITSKRPRIVALHILEHGFVTTEQLETLYGYKHPPRAACDLRELGIPLETTRVKDSSERSIAAYRFGDLTKVVNDRLAGRRVIPKRFKQALLAHSGNKCNICQTVYDGRYLQVDHRVPYGVAGDTISAERDINDYMLICAECNRAKSWSCEHCSNWQEAKLPTVCLACYWAKPENYKHIALRKMRRVEVVWEDAETEIYDRLSAKAAQMNITLSEYIKTQLDQIEP
jgi:hypothetical protein